MVHCMDLFHRCTPFKWKDYSFVVCWKAIKKTERSPQVKNASLISQKLCVENYCWASYLSPASDHLNSVLSTPNSWQVWRDLLMLCSYSTAQSGNLSEGYAARAPLIWKFETTTWLFSLQRCTWFLTPLSEFSSFSKVFCLDPWPHIHW